MMSFFDGFILELVPSSPCCARRVTCRFRAGRAGAAGTPSGSTENRPRSPRPARRLPG